MKRIATVVTGLVLVWQSGCGLFVDGPWDANPCEQASNVMASGFAEFCVGARDNCLFCECYLEGQVVNDAGDGCEDPEDGGGEEFACEGESLTSAEECLADEAACKQDAADMAEMVCKAGHIGDECETAADCPFELDCGAAGCEL